MNHFSDQGRLNRLKIIAFLKSIDYWATVKFITQQTGISGRTIVYAHCHNLVREGILRVNNMLINGRMVMVYRLKRH